MDEHIRKEFADIPFGELKKLKEKLGTKTYNEALFGSRKESNKNFARINKNRPREISSKKPVSQFRDVFQVKKKMKRDPRFDDLSGEFNDSIFKKTFSFLNDVKAREKLELQKLLQEEEDPDRKNEIRFLLKRIKNQEHELRRKNAIDEQEKTLKKETIEQLKTGKKPYFIKQSEKKKMQLAEQYKELKKSGKLDKYLEKKRKKNARKDSSLLPV